jgi:hypothetical protein
LALMALMSPPMSLRFLLQRLLVQWRFVENETELIDQRLGACPRFSI